MFISLLIIWVTLFFLSKSLSLKPFPPWINDVRIFSSFWFWKSETILPFFPISNVTSTTFGCFTSLCSQKMSVSKVEDDVVGKRCNRMSILDLPDLVLDTILDKLPPEGLCRMANVCSELREKCLGDYLWERHMKQKWDRVIGPAAHREWQWHIAAMRNDLGSNIKRRKGLFGFLFRVLSSQHDKANKQISSTPVDSLVSFYSALESGTFWFPAQVYNRENGHVGFMLSCYDAELKYDRRTDTFQARYPPHGRRAIAVENGVTWERIRAPPVDALPHDLHLSDSFSELRPGDHIEIQWRRNKEFPYGWWYGVAGHLESCDGNQNLCCCHRSGMVVLEFNQYAPGSRWRLTFINRKDHREEGNEVDGFYGGVRKIASKDEISIWQQLWPTEVLE